MMRAAMLLSLSLPHTHTHTSPTMQGGPALVSPLFFYRSLDHAAATYGAEPPRALRGRGSGSAASAEPQYGTLSSARLAPDSGHLMESKGWIHASVQKRGHQPEPQRCLKVPGSNLFQCPFCSLAKFKAAKPYKVKIHLAWHVRGAVEYGDYVMYRCGFECRPKFHFHCPGCCGTIIRKEDFHKHFEICKHSRFLRSTPQAPTPTPPSPAVAPTPTPASPAVAPTPTPASPAVAPTPTPPAPADPPTQNLEEEPVPNTMKEIRVGNKIQVNCPHCNLLLNKKNLKVHVQRKHTKPEVAGTSAASQLQTSPLPGQLENCEDQL
ncbi:uncharacterized protein [Salminus brasiliensis]|uniref:uncharacterized protein n=1 Tax=Salminus brasiliensis TaxID=930266 RepID=UPI003B82DC4F